MANFQLIQNTNRFDLMGVVASSLCMIHCIATPFLFIAQACAVSCCADAPVWWQIVDYLFIVVSFFAIYFATRNSTKSWVRFALWSAWVLLFLTLLSKTFLIPSLPKAFIYVPALSIVGLHIYNLKYCKCVEQECCLNKM